MTFIEFIGTFKNWFSTTKEKLEKDIIPDKKVLVSHSNNRTQFYIRTSKDKKGKYIKEANRKEEVTPVAQSMYASMLLNLMIENQEKVDAIDEVTLSLSKAWKKLSDDLKPYVQPYILTNEAYKQWWIAQSYVPFSREKLETFDTKKGDVVRSKAEWIIADALFDAGIPYKYEAPLVLGKWTVHPDFTALLVNKQKEIYIEHLGMLSDPSYFRKAMKKIKSYQEHGLLLGRDFLITFEYQKDDFNAKSVKGILDFFERGE